MHHDTAMVFAPTHELLPLLDINTYLIPGPADLPHG